MKRQTDWWNKVTPYYLVWRTHSQGGILEYPFEVFHRSLEELGGAEIPVHRISRDLVDIILKEARKDVATKTA